MKKIIGLLLILTLPTLASAEERDFPYTYKGEVVFKDGEVITYEKYVTYRCDVTRLSFDTCLTTTRSQAKQGCVDEAIALSITKPYVTRRCIIS